MRDCPKCGDAVPNGKLGMHNRTVHAPDLVIHAPASEGSR